MSIAHYMLQVNIYLLVFFCFYKLLLDRETYFTLNRVYLITAGVLSLAIPFIRFEWLTTQHVSRQVYSGFDHLSGFVSGVSVIPAQAEKFNWGNLIAFVYICGILFFLCRFIVRLLALKKIFRQHSPGRAFSFLNKKVVDAAIPGQATVNVHEEVHIRQKHSLDILFFESIAIFTWFNPVVYGYKRAVQHIHEFLADEEAASFQGDKEAYALLLLSRAIGARPSDLTNGFVTRSLLKKRIFMLHKKRSTRIAVLKYGLFVPVFALALILSSATIRKNNQLIEVADQIPLNNIKETVNLAIGKPLRIVEVVMANTYQHLPQKNKHKEVRPWVLTFNTSPVQNTDTEYPPAEPVTTESKELRLAFQPATIETGTIKYADKFEIDNIKYTDKPENGNIKFAEKPQEVVYQAVLLENPPTYPGGMAKFYENLGTTIKYPAEALENRIYGKVMASFTIEKDGSLSNITTEGKKLGYGLEEEAVRAIKLSRRWSPGLQNGRPVAVKFAVPIVFNLPGSEQQPIEVKNVKADNRNYFQLNLRSLTKDKPLKVEDVVFIVDGVKKDYATFSRMNPELIENISIIKDAAATSNYSPDGEKGIITIKTKALPLKNVNIN